MKRSILLEYSMLERLTSKPDLINIVIGTGALARDMHKKLLLLGLKAPFLIGDYSEPARDVRHYNEIAALGDPKRYRFIMCCDYSEWELMAPAQMATYRFLGVMARNHPQLIEISNYTNRYEHAGKQAVDAMNCNVILQGGKPYALFGDAHDTEAFAIHTVGGCFMGGIYNHTPYSPAKALYGLLTAAGFNCVLYVWGQPISPCEDNIVRLIRDICLFRCDLMVLASGIAAANPLHMGVKNVLATRASSMTTKHPFILRCKSLKINACDGIDHDTSLLELRKTQQRIFLALARLHGFAFWDILMPHIDLLLKSQAMTLRKKNAEYVERKEKTKRELLFILDRCCTRDYTQAFATVEDAHPMFSDSTHLSDEGNKIVAERLAMDILGAYQ